MGNGDVSTWDVSSVKDMSAMFYEATEFNSDVSDWVVSSVKNMGAMFGNAKELNGDVSSVKDMSGMFYGASEFNQQMCWPVDEGDVFDGNLCSSCIECAK